MTHFLTNPRPHGLGLSTRLLACGLLGLSACAGSVATIKPSDPLSIERLYPLRAGSVWTYDVDTGQTLTTLAITRVTASADGRIEVTSGADPIVYERRPEGLFRPDRNAYILKAPVTKGARWDAGADGEAEVTATDKSVSTPAGDFNQCVEVVERSTSVGKLVRTVFCPDVGPVELESSLQMSLSGEVARVHATLRGYDFSGALVEPETAP